MEKLIRNNEVAVLVSPGFGAGWYSWHSVEELLFDPSIVQWVENKEIDKIQIYMELKYPEVYCGGLEDLVVQWVPSGEKFRIDEYDGNETLVLALQEHWLTA
ncbi:hypothetical protein UFOVP190_147 [uncultured Caudovirales phage]|uniref:Uncharacterized protein n=1 Tax=uncultured Caudovirales phage TaxID=2100421 RepID=A0A6J7WHH6_9CAUD|nr:hypothetical protein UFOVP190_147 [uncultured Caudovirales phage]